MVHLLWLPPCMVGGCVNMCVRGIWAQKFYLKNTNDGFNTYFIKIGKELLQGHH